MSPFCSRPLVAGSLPLNLTVYIVEDSASIRRGLVGKLRSVCRRIGGDFNFHEYSSVESIMPHLDDFVHNSNVLVTVDENLDSSGGRLLGSDLILALVKADFRGIIISASGDEATARDHERLGANLVWGKPLPTWERMLESLCCIYHAKVRRKRPSRPRVDGAYASASAATGM